MWFTWYTSLHNLNAYQIKFFNQLEKKENMCLNIVYALGSSHYFKGIFLFQTLKFYDDEISCKQANLLVTYLLVLSVTVVNACVYYTSGYILSNFKQFTDLD